MVIVYRQAKTVAKTAEHYGLPLARRRKDKRLNCSYYLTEFLIKQPYERGDSLRQKLVDAKGGSLSAEDAARALGISKAALLKRYKNGKPIAWRAERQSPVRFPIWQFREHKIVGGIEESLKILNANDLLNDFGIVLFFLAKHRFLGGKRPMDCLREGELEKARHTAEAYSE
jgi:hypothetical protein